MSEVAGEIGVREAMRAELPAAMRRGDRAAVSAIRCALASIENAESVAVDPPPTSATDSTHFAGATSGLGSAEVARRSLTEADELALVSQERDERRAESERMQALGQTQQSERLIAEAEALDAFLC